MIAVHRIDPPTFDALASGLGGPAAVRKLWRGQRSKRLLLLALLAESWPHPTDERDRALAVLAKAETEAPHEVREVLAEPLVGAWAASTVRRLRRGHPYEPALAQELGHLNAVAAVAAVRAGTDADLTGHVRDGWLHLPALGRLRVPSGRTHVRLTARDGHLWSDGAAVEPSSTAFQPRRTLSGTGMSIHVHLDDIDPYRDTYHVAATDRLLDGEAEEWQRCFAGTWQILTQHAPERAAEMAYGLHSLIPLTKPEEHGARSATALESVGVVGLDPPRSCADFAVTLVHEFQHSKLTALVDIVSLYDGSSSRTFNAPWRTDARPISGLFQGVYAFLGVTDMWRALSAAPGTFPQAPSEFATARLMTTDALDTLVGSGLLTDAGQRFVDGMRRTMNRLHTVTLPASVLTAAEAELVVRRRAHRDAREPS